VTIDNSYQDVLSKYIIVCIPAYNEEKNIADIIKGAKKYAREVIVYDDGSIDKTSEVATECGAIVIKHPQNKGYGKALSALFQQALLKNPDIMVTLDSDGQHNVDQIPIVVGPLIRNEADIVIGSRFLTKDDTKHVPYYRRVGIRAITRVTQAASYNKLTDSQSGFRAYNMNALTKLKLYEDGMAISTEILLRASESNLRMVEVPIKIIYKDDSSTHNPFTHGLTVFSHVIKYLSFKKPLLFYGVPGLVLIVISAFFMYNALDLFSNTRFVSTNMVLLSLGFAIMGILLLATSAIVYTIVFLFKGYLNNR